MSLWTRTKRKGRPRNGKYQPWIKKERGGVWLIRVNEEVDIATTALDESLDTIKEKKPIKKWQITTTDQERKMKSGVWLSIVNEEVDIAATASNESLDTNKEKGSIKKQQIPATDQETTNTSHRSRKKDGEWSVAHQKE